MKKAATLGVLSAVLVGMGLGLFSGCDEDKGMPPVNNPPGVRLTAFPPDSGTAGYDVEFYWEGWDSDGEVDHFIYAIDPPDMYDSTDSVWVKTEAYSGSFLFKASDFDTLYNWRQPQIAKSWHVFVIKAVDDMGAISEPDYVAFNAATIAPRTQFTSPEPANGIQAYMGSPQEVGRRVTFRWEGRDADGLSSEAPVGYLLKALDVSGKREAQLVKTVWADTSEWIEYGGGDRKVVLDFDDGHNYAVAIRAIDEAGAVEPLLLLNGNMMWVGARGAYTFPELAVRSLAFGRRSWTGWEPDPETYEVPIGSRYEFTISAKADWYGGLITGFSYAWDLEDVDSNDTDPEGEGAWTPWNMSRTTIAAAFLEQRDRYLYVRCKDDGGGRTLATIRFRVIEPEATKNLCYIDDWRKYSTNPALGEALDDEVWQTMLEGYNYGKDWDEVSWDEWAAPYGEDAPSLEFLSKFRVIVWSLNDNRSTALNQQSAWYYMNGLSSVNVLALYMTGRVLGGEKGKVWAFGRGLVESSLLDELGMFCDYPYAVDADMNTDPDCGIKEDTFATQYLHITGEFDPSNMRSGGTRVSLFSQFFTRSTHVFVDTAGPAIPGDKYTRAPASELYPNLPPKLLFHQDFWDRGLGNLVHFEVLDYPRPDQERQDIFYDPVSEKMTGLIPLYRLHAALGHPANETYCGFRYIPSEPTDPSEIVYFFFPMFIFDDSQIRATAKVVLSDWFGLPDPDAAVPGGGGEVHGGANVVR